MSRVFIALALFGGALAGVGCTDNSGAPALAIDHLAPGGGPNDRAVEVRVFGGPFLIAATQRLSAGEPVSLDAGYRAFLGDLPLEAVARLDAGALTARVPSGMTPGSYPLRVEGPYGSAVLDAAYEVRTPRPPKLSSQVGGPAKVSLGQTFPVTMTVSNEGDFAAVAVAPSPLTPTGPGRLALTQAWAPASADVAPLSSTVFTSQFQATAVGPVTLSGEALGVDGGGASLTAPVATSAPILVQRRAALVATWSIPRLVVVGSTFSATLSITNTGEADALAVLPTTPVTFGSATVRIEPSTLTPSTVSAGQTVTFELQLTATANGGFWLVGGAEGVDGNDGGAVSAASATSANSYAGGEATELVFDPFGEAGKATVTVDAQVLAYEGQLYVGPNRDGSKAWRTDGTTTGIYTADYTGNKNGADAMRNLAPGTPPYPTLGVTACTADTTACGPDNEDGRPFWSSGVYNSQEYVLAASARSAGDLRTSYWNQPKTLTRFSAYVFAKSGGPASRKAVTAIHFFGGMRVYFAASDSGAGGPWLFKLTGSGGDIDLVASAMPGLSDALGGTRLIDAVSNFSGRLYLANRHGCMRSAGLAAGDPGPYATSPGDWAECTPSAPEWAAEPGLTTTKTFGFQPADRAVSGLVAFGSRFYLARNTANGPQLWVCAPGLTGTPSDCDPGDWSLVAANSTGRTTLTQFDDATNARLTLLAATANHLYVGFDRPDGIAIYRSAVSEPSARGDFEGAGGCRAGASCVPYGDRGLGQASNTRIFDGRAATIGGIESVFVTAGDGSSPIRLYRLTD